MTEQQPATLRDRLAEALAAWGNRRFPVCDHTQIISYGEAADAVLPIVEQHTRTQLAAEPSVAAVVRATRIALAACLDKDDDAARQVLDGLTGEQVRQVEDAAVALSLHASVLRGAAPHDQASGIRLFLDANPDAFTHFMRREVRRDPEWLATFVRAQIRAGNIDPFGRY